MPDYKIGFHRPVPAGIFSDPPEMNEEMLYLFTLPYIQLVEVLADVLFPPRATSLDGVTGLLRASDARIDRYVLFKSAWQPEFGKRFQLALRDLTEFCVRLESTHYANLSIERQVAILEGLEQDMLPGWTGTNGRSAKRCFETIYDTISEGFFGEPGYGGNHDGIGWEYSNFISTTKRL
jgi:hypothetical protein